MPGRVLVVAYDFPPVGGVGILRTLKYATYLPDSGWDPTILTARNPGVAIRDEDAERSLPATLVVERAFSPEPVKLRRALGRAARRVKRPFGGGAPGAGVASISAPASAPSAPAMPVAPAPARSRRFGRVTALWSAALRLTFYPDEEVGWAPFAVRRGLRANRRAPFDVVYSSSPPISSHLAAGLIARRARVPWVADFRDPWIGNAFAGKPLRLHGYLQKRIERRIVHLADRVVFATEGMREAYAERYPRVASRFVTIPNGYDRNDLPGATMAAPGDAPAPARDGRFHLAYGGSLYGRREFQIFLDGLELFVARKPEIRDRLTVEFIGWLNLHNQGVAARYSTPERLGSILKFTGFVPHREAVARLVKADALLQVIADDPNKGQIQGGKLMEYVGLDRQILAVVPEGKARDLLRELDWGIIADPTPEGVADGLERLLSTPAPARRADPEGRYDRVNLARRLAVLLDEVRDEAAAKRR